MEPHLKSPRAQQPFVLELSSLEKVIGDVVKSDKSDFNKTKSRDSPKLKCCNDTETTNSKYYQHEHESDLIHDDKSDCGFTDSSNSKGPSCIPNFADGEYLSDSDMNYNNKEEKNKNDVCSANSKCGYKNNINTLNNNNFESEYESDDQEKTGLDKLIPYHLFSCINPDIMIKINEVEFGAHRPLLQLYTTYFEEAIADLDDCVIVLPENKVRMDIFQAIYSWMLHDSEDALNFLNRQNIANIYAASKFLNIEELIETCETILRSEELFNEMTAFSLFIEAYNLSDQKMQSMMLPRIQNVFLHIVSSSLFVNLPIDVILMLLSSDNIRVNSELDVFYTAAKWLLHEWPNRNFNTNRVMRLVRFALLSPSQLVDLKRCPDSPMIKMITNGKDILKLIDDGMALSVKLETHRNSPDYFKEECNKLGLNLPAPRNWFNDCFIHQSYEEFLRGLELIKKKHNYS